MGRTGAKPTFGSGGAVFLVWSTFALGATADPAGFDVADCPAITTVVAASAMPAIPSKTVIFDLACMHQLYHPCVHFHW
jgi:hypothetical protein